MRTLKKQQGLSSIAWLAIILCVAFFGVSAFKIVPKYMDNWYIVNALKSLEQLTETGEDPSLITKSEIRGHLSNQFIVNNVRGNEISFVEVDVQRDKFIVDLNYEARVPLIYSIDVVVKFENQFDSSRPNDCCKPPKK